jgi:hypothetical protein
MAASSLMPRLTDILDAIDRIRAEMAGVSIEAFEADWRKRWLVERGVEIISEQPPPGRRTEGAAPGDPVAEGGGDRKHSASRI